jgi:hypothetical protein
VAYGRIKPPFPPVAWALRRGETHLSCPNPGEAERTAGQLRQLSAYELPMSPFKFARVNAITPCTPQRGFDVRVSDLL